MISEQIRLTGTGVSLRLLDAEEKARQAILNGPSLSRCQRPAD